MKTKIKIAVVAVAWAAFGAFGETWYFDSRLNLDTKDKNVGSRVLNDMSCWTNSFGQSGSGTPTASDHLIFDGDLDRLRASSTAFNAFTGGSIQIGTADKSETLVYDGGDITASGYPLKLHYAYLFCNVTASRNVGLPIEILSENAAKPAVICIGQLGYSNLVYSFTGPISGSANAQLRFGRWTRNKIGTDFPACARNSTFPLHDITQYAGTITVTSVYANAGSDFGTHLVTVGTQTSAAKLRIETGGSLSLASNSDTLTVKELSFGAGSRLWVTNESLNAQLPCVHATDALTVTGPVEVYYGANVFGFGAHRIPILAGPSGSTFTESDFTLTLAGTIHNRNPHLEVATDEVTGEHVLYVVVNGLIDQISAYNKEGGRDGSNGTASSITNAAAWRDGKLPDQANLVNDAYLNGTYRYYTKMGLRTEFMIRSLYRFPGEALILDGAGASLIIQSKTFEVPEVFCYGGGIGVGQGHGSANNPITLSAPHIHFPKAGVTNNILAYSAAVFVFDGEIDGPGDLSVAGWNGTSSPKASYELNGMNTNFTGSIKISQGEYRDQYISFDDKFPTLYVNDGRNLGGRKAEFDPRALTLTHMAKLLVTNRVAVTLEDGLNRGVYMWEKARFDVSSAVGVLDVRWPVLLSGKMWKEGPGTLILRKRMKHEVDDGGELSDVPRAGSNLFEIVAGTVKIAHADALAGVETTIDAGASIQLVLDPDDADLMRYGIRNTAVDAPFALDASFGGKLPLTVDATAVPPPDGVMLTNGIVTVNATAAQTVGGMLPDFGRLWSGVSTKLVPIEEDGMVTFALVSKRIGTMFCIR